MTSWQNDDAYFTPSANSLSIDCERSGIVVIDVDDHGDGTGLAVWRRIEQECDGPFDTFTVESGTGGRHYYFTAEGLETSPLNCTASKCFTIDSAIAPIDLRGKGGVIFAAPSSYKTLDDTTLRYRVLNDSAPCRRPPKLQEYLTTNMASGSAPPPADKKGKAKKRRQEQVCWTVEGPPEDAAGEETPAPPAGEEAPEDAAPRQQVDMVAVARARAVLTTFAQEGVDKAIVDETWNNHDNIVRIAFALNNVCGGQELLLEDFLNLIRSSDKAEANYRTWGTKLYKTPAKAGAHRPGLPFLCNLETQFLDKIGADPAWLLPFREAQQAATGRPATNESSGSSRSLRVCP